jgi:hypothetical protein
MSYRLWNKVRMKKQGGPQIPLAIRVCTVHQNNRCLRDASLPHHSSLSRGIHGGSCSRLLHAALRCERVLAILRLLIFGARACSKPAPARNVEIALRRCHDSLELPIAVMCGPALNGSREVEIVRAFEPHSAHLAVELCPAASRANSPCLLCAVKRPLGPILPHSQLAPPLTRAVATSRMSRQR